MHLLKSMSFLFILLFAVNIFPADTFEFFPQKCTAHLETGHIWFVDNDSNEKTGPELYADDTNAKFFTLIKNSIILQFTNITSQNHGQYDCIIPES